MQAQTTVLITGAAGFLGQHFLRYHLREKHSITACDNFSNSSPLDWFPVVRADAAEFIADLGGPFDIAYHFAAPVGGRIKIENDPLFNADALRLDTAFFRWAIGKVGIAIYPSSSAIYGVKYQDRFATDPLPESLCDLRSKDWAQPDEMYGFIKLAGEMLALKAERYGLNTLCIRPFSGYGPGQGLEYPVPAICARAKAHEDPLTVWGGAQVRDFVYIDDLVQITLRRLSNGVHGYQTMNVGSGKPVSFDELATMAANICGYRPSRSSDQEKPIGVFYRVADTSLMTQYGSPVWRLGAGLQQVINSLP